MRRFLLIFLFLPLTIFAQHRLQGNFNYIALDTGIIFKMTTDDPVWRIRLMNDTLTINGEQSYIAGGSGSSNWYNVGGTLYPVDTAKDAGVPRWHYLRIGRGYITNYNDATDVKLYNNVYTDGDLHVGDSMFVNTLPFGGLGVTSDTIVYWSPITKLFSRRRLSGVSSVSQSWGLIATPNPITSTGNIRADSSVLQTKVLTTSQLATKVTLGDTNNISRSSNYATPYWVNYVFRKKSDHDSLSTLDEKSYNSLTDKPTTKSFDSLWSSITLGRSGLASGKVNFTSTDGYTGGIQFNGGAIMKFTGALGDYSFDGNLSTLGNYSAGKTAGRYSRMDSTHLYTDTLILRAKNVSTSDSILVRDVNRVKYRLLSSVVDVGDNTWDLSFTSNTVRVSPYTDKILSDPGYAYFYNDRGGGAPSYRNVLNMDGKLYATGASISDTISGTSVLYVSNTGSGSLATGITGLSITGYGVYGSSDSSAGVYGNSDVNVGVYGNSSSNAGVYGNSSSNAGVYGNSSSNVGVYGNSSSNVGVYGNSSSNVGVYGYSSNNTGVYGYSVTSRAITASISPSSTNPESEVLKLSRLSSGTPSAGIGGYMSFFNYNSSRNEKESGRIVSKLTSVKNGSESSSFTWWTRRAGTLAQKMELDSNGVLTTDTIHVGENTNYVSIDSINGLRLHGTSTVWDELMFPFEEGQKAGNTYPTYVADSGYYNFSIDTVADGGVCKMYMIVQLPHKWQQNSNLHPHVHYKHTTTEGTPTFICRYRWFNIGEVPGVFTWIKLNTTTGTTNNTHQLVESATGTINGSGKTLSSILQCEIYLENTSTATKTCSAYQFDIHYIIDSMGSKEEVIK